MRNIALTVSVAFVSFTLASCSTVSTFYPSSSSGQPTGPRDSAANTIRSADNSGVERALDKYDQEKMSHALDKPLGKSSDWSNPRTGTSYTVTPVSKLTYNGNPYCRKYTIVTSKGSGQRQSTGTACVSTTDSSWQVVN